LTANSIELKVKKVRCRKIESEDGSVTYKRHKADPVPVSE
jgi:hypothetical protein